MNIKNICNISKKEFITNFKNYWFLLSAFIFLIFNFSIIYFSDVISGDYSKTDVRAMSLSIIHLQMYIIPLLSFILSYDAILSEKESGILDLMLTYRVTFFDIFLGKLFGNSFIFTLAFLIGFLPICFYLFFLGIKFIIIFKFVIVSIWLSFIFNFFALCISNASVDRTFVILLSIFFWLFFVFIYDLIFTFFVVYFYGVVSNNIFTFLLFFNPVEVFRLVSIFYFMPSEINDLFGINIGFLNSFYISFIMFFWCIVCFFLVRVKY